MSFINYDSFVETVKRYLARDDLDQAIPDFIELAQERLSRDLRIQEMLKISTATANSGDSTISFPRDFLELREIHVQAGSVYQLDYQTPDKFFRNGKTEQSGVPVFFTMIADEFKFAPRPSGGQKIQILYYAKPNFMSPTNPSNSYLEDYPDALLYATLAEAEPYLMNDERIAVWGSLYDRAIENIRKHDKGVTFSSARLNVTIS